MFLNLFQQPRISPGRILLSEDAINRVILGLVSEF